MLKVVELGLKVVLAAEVSEVQNLSRIEVVMRYDKEPESLKE